MLYAVMHSIREYYLGANASVKTIIRFAVAAAFLNLIGSFSEDLAELASIVSVFLLPWIMYCRIWIQRGVEVRTNLGKMIFRGLVCGVASVIPRFLTLQIAIELPSFLQTPVDFASGFVCTFFLGILFNALTKGVETRRVAVSSSMAAASSTAASSSAAATTP